MDISMKFEGYSPKEKGYSIDPEGGPESNLGRFTFNDWIKLDDSLETADHFSEIPEAIRSHHEENGQARFKFIISDGSSQTEFIHLMLSMEIDCLVSVMKYPDDAGIHRITLGELQELLSIAKDNDTEINSYEDLSEKSRIRLYDFYLKYTLKEAFSKKKVKSLQIDPKDFL